MDAPPVQYARTSDGVGIAYMVCGDGLPLVKLPNPFNHIQLLWRPDSPTSAWLAAFAASVRLVIYDARCQGLSSRGQPAAEWIEGEVRDLSAVVDHLHLDSFVLLADYGRTHTAVHFACRHPELVRTMVLTAPFLSGADRVNVVADRLAERDWDFFLRTQVPVGSPSEVAERILSYNRAATTQADWVHNIRAFATSGISAAAQQVRVPTLVIHPRGSGFVKEEESAAVAARIPNARLVVMDGSGFPQNAAPLLEVLTEFLESQPDPASGSRVIGTGSVPAGGQAREQVGLSSREAEVLRLLAAGRSNQEIADELVISRNTVRRHVSNIFDKTGAANRAQAAIYARDRGLA